MHSEQPHTMPTCTDKVILPTKKVGCEYVKCLQEEYNTYYEDKSRNYMLKLEEKSVEIQNHMHDSVTQNFDRVSGLHDNGSTPSQGQEDNQPVDVSSPENAIDDDVIDIRTIYPPWSRKTNDMCDIIQIANDKSMKDIRDEICKDTPVKTEINKPYIDNIDAYNRDRHLITTSLSERLDLGQNSLLGAQQVRVAVKHTDQIPEFPEHLRQISLGEEIENISHAIIDRNTSFIPQVDGIVDSRDRLDRTPDSIDLTESPVKHMKTQKQIEKINEDTNDNDTDETITYKTDELKNSNRKNINTVRKRAENIEVKKGRTAKIYTMNVERKRILEQRREKTLQNAKDKRPAEEYFLTALKASHEIHKALKNTQKSKKSDNGLINDENTNITTIADNINNLEIVANNEVNVTTNAEDTDIEPADTDNIYNAETEIDKSEDIVMSDDNDDNPAMSDQDSPHATSGDDNAENSEPGEGMHPHP